ncbi:venom prothrombin activator notecarin-D2 [Acyrthosiphon pisum]|uniref:Peptidase S1 domain-containing protein n=1 Tax=Acyrthosiphon pisum TaxID=7029 RepID=A0A8R2A7T3_ACYPI|nr:venom prothrombin activator notecarin-D2 [Acyrthosiphon pisum]|eukprot:XP_003244613.1 PREDICTED: venom prothrombin activator notecarin-D2 [Acyrthosiphon pisum]
MIMGGETAPIGTAPWNVGVYRFNTKNSNNYDLICGGSIISPILVVSAAHCFWGKGMLSNRISVNDGQYKIAVGKYSRSITIIDNEFTKIMNVTTVYLGEYYYGPSGFHADDIAIVVLQNRISFSIGVSPVCVDWMGIHTIPNGAKGKIVGWGQTEKGIDSPILLEGSLPYINYTSCRNMYTNGFESYVTKDKFCAGSTLGQGAHQGDSGASLSFSHSNLYYLTGVASVKDSNTNNSIAVFTEVKHHIQWIRRLYDEHN